MSDIASIAQVVARGSRLSLALHELGARVPTATEDVSRIAKAVSLVSLELRQAGETLRQGDEIASGEAIETIQDVLLRCDAAYEDIEKEVPVSLVRFPSSSAEALVILPFPSGSSPMMSVAGAAVSTQGPDMVVRKGCMVGVVPPTEMRVEV